MKSLGYLNTSKNQLVIAGVIRQMRFTIYEISMTTSTVSAYSHATYLSIFSLSLLIIFIYILIYHYLFIYLSIFIYLYLFIYIVW